MHERIVVGVDFSATSYAALLQALFMARSSGGELHVVHVIDVFGDNPLVEVLRSAVDDEEVERKLVEESDTRMREFVQDVDLIGVRTKFVHTRAPNVAEALVSYARDQNADLIALGTHGRKGWKRLFLGSVAVRLIGVSDCPLLLVRQSKAEAVRDPVDRILVPLDLSETSMAALRHADLLAQSYHAHLDVVHVVEPYVLPVSLTGIRQMRDLVPTILSDVRKELEALFARLEDPPTSHRIHVLEGIASEKIVEASSELNSDLIVMTNRRLTHLERVALGSTIEKVSKIAEVPLYVIPVDQLVGDGGAPSDATPEARV